MSTPLNRHSKRIFLSAVLATAGLGAFAQTPPPAGGPADAGQRPPMGRPDGAGRMDPAKMQDMMARHQAQLKDKLKITQAQEGAWTSYTTAMKPPANPQRPDRAEMDKLTTPERIDKMKALRAQRDAEMDKRADATKTFYATLTPEQKKVFDTETARMHHPGGHQGPHGGPGEGGGRPGMGPGRG